MSAPFACIVVHGALDTSQQWFEALHLLGRAMPGHETRCKYERIHGGFCHRHISLYMLPVAVTAVREDGLSMTVRRRGRIIAEVTP